MKISVDCVFRPGLQHHIVQLQPGSHWHSIVVDDDDENDEEQGEYGRKNSTIHLVKIQL